MNAARTGQREEPIGLASGLSTVQTSRSLVIAVRWSCHSFERGIRHVAETKIHLFKFLASVQAEKNQHPKFYHDCERFRQRPR